jgi:y4mF family transcriptional regulator
MEIGSFVRARRRSLNLTQQQLAELAGVGLNFVYQLEKNKPTVQLDCTRQVLAALGYDLTVSPRGLTLETSPRSKPRLPWDD